MNRSWYSASLPSFLNSTQESVLGELVKHSETEVLPTQRDAWIEEIRILRRELADLGGQISMEFSIPRMGKRIDVVIITKSVIFVLEFKSGETRFENSALNQVWDYALDLKNFHAGSHQAPIFPILIATQANHTENNPLVKDLDDVFRPQKCSPIHLRNTIEKSLQQAAGKNHIVWENWITAPYKPTPTIIDAARALYANHSVDEIIRSGAGSENISLTSNRIEDLITSAIEKKQKIICFVTGVPGSGKTLVGLNLATRHRRELNSSTHAVFLSGNGPLVTVLREALTRDEVERQKNLGVKARKSHLGESVKAFIQNVHHFRDHAIIDTGAPFEHVVIFDEAQRAWNAQQTSNFMQRKKGLVGFSQSESEFLISCMDRHKDWAVVVCLVGGGHEINTGEDGIAGWINAIHRFFPHWEMYISPSLEDSEYAAGKSLSDTNFNQNTFYDNCLHLGVSMRSFRSEKVSFFVKSLLDCNEPAAREALGSFADGYPIILSRDLQRAKDWVRQRARGSSRFGMVASSRAQRLKPHAVDVRIPVDPVHWFLSDRDDTRSSYYMEDAATEFQVQGLELDWTCVTWDGDFRYSNSGWTCFDFRGSRWTHIRSQENQKYLKNAYRVLLTRARQGMAIFVPHGDKSDPTRTPEFYNPTFDYLKRIGIPCID